MQINFLTNSKSKSMESAMTTTIIFTLIILIVACSSSVSSFNLDEEFPSPPVKPERFATKEELKACNLKQNKNEI